MPHLVFGLQSCHGRSTSRLYIKHPRQKYRDIRDDRPVFLSLGDVKHACRDCQLGGEGATKLGDQQGHVHRLGLLGRVLVEQREEEEIPSTELVLNHMGF